MDNTPTVWPVCVPWERWLGARAPTLANFKRYSDEQISLQWARLTTLTKVGKNSVPGKAQQDLKTKLQAAGLSDTDHLSADIVTALNALMTAVYADICTTERALAHAEKAQAERSPLGATKSAATDSHLLAVTTTDKESWSKGPIAVDINDSAVPDEIRVLCAFILQADDVVGLVFPQDEVGGKALPGYGEKAYDGAFVPDPRVPGARRRSVSTKQYGVMRSWHMDVPGYLYKKRRDPVEAPLFARYLKVNAAEFASGYGIEEAASVRNYKGGPTLVESGGLFRPQGLAEFNVLFGTNGRLLFDYSCGDFYLSSHYQPYEVPSDIVKDFEKLKGTQCFPYFKLVGADSIQLTLDGHMELGRLRYWENRRREGYANTLQ
jgi:hypothetical protein